MQFLAFSCETENSVTWNGRCAVFWKQVFLATSKVHCFYLLFVQHLPGGVFCIFTTLCAIKGVMSDENQFVFIFVKVTTPRVTKLSKFVNKTFRVFSSSFCSVQHSFLYMLSLFSRLKSPALILCSTIPVSCQGSS